MTTTSPMLEQWLSNFKNVFLKNGIQVQDSAASHKAIVTDSSGREERNRRLSR